MKNNDRSTPFSHPQELSDSELDPVFGGLNTEALALAQRMPALCPHCGLQKTRPAGCDVAGNIIYYLCPGCGKTFFGKISASPPYRLTTYVYKPPVG